MSNELKRRFKMQELHEEIKMAAYELYEQRGMAQGYDLDDWLRAERTVIKKDITDNIANSPAKEKKPSNSKSKKKGDQR
jgi:hypothetical protein